MTSTTLKKVKISSKGQITLPKKLLVKLGLRYGDYIDIVEETESIRISPRKDKVLNILDNLHNRIQILPELASQDVDGAIAEAKSIRYSTKD